MADEKQPKKFKASPLDGKQNVSRNTDVYTRLQNYKNEDLVKISFSEGKILSQNQGNEVPLDTLATDEKDFTGPNEGFYAQNKAKGWFDK